MVSREHPPFSRGGGAVYSGYLQRLLPDYGIELMLIVGSAWTARAYTEKINNVTIYRLPVFGDTFLTRIPSFSYSTSRLIPKLEKGFDLIYDHSAPLFCPTAIPLISHFHSTRLGEYRACRMIKRNMHAFLNKLYIPFDRRLITSSSGAIAVSDTIRNELIQTAEAGKKAVVIPNGVDTDLFKPLKNRSFGSAVKNILYAGRLDPRKGLDTLLYAYKQLNKNIKAVLTVVGTGPEQPRLRRLAQSLDISVDFRGFVPHEKLAQEYNEADVFVLPSLYEPFGLVALEAMACATATITSSACPRLGIPQFKKADAGDLARCLSELLTSKQALQQLSELSLHLSAQYSWQKIIPLIIEYLKQFV